MLPHLHQAGHRVYRPYLRGFGPTRFREADRLRSGQAGALGQDLSDFVEALDLHDVVVAGHDWGARAGYVVGALFPEADPGADRRLGGIRDQPGRHLRAVSTGPCLLVRVVRRNRPRSPGAGPRPARLLPLPVEILVARVGLRRAGVRSGGHGVGQPRLGRDQRPCLSASLGRGTR
ncbi:alpha/beta fold hydrolase [Streptomyces carpinensis]|uniref:Alpha/beta fold hydrolase n=1 Tax=Streptomyces carpinensis TaxID=66369 RepID=A0ABV1WD67_9ACTN